MHYSTLEKLGIQVSKLGFGAMRLPIHEDHSINQEAVNEMIDYALDSGVNYFDTAMIYHNGESEVALGKALNRHPRESFYVADKMSFWLAKSSEDLDRLFNRSLERLGMEYIDFYLMHSLNVQSVATLKAFGGVEWALEKQRQGKIKYLGFSIHDDADVLREILDLHTWDFAQIQYNYLDEKDRPGKEGYDELVRRQIPIIIMEPLKGGLLATMPDPISKPLKDLGNSLPSYSFRWLAEQPYITTILSGMTYMPHVQDNVHTFSNLLTPLSEVEMGAISRVKELIEENQKVGCTGCKYCLPCPLDIDIPSIFSAWNLKSMNQSGNWIAGADINYDVASKCISCGKCMKECPQKIAIPDKFKELLASR